MGLDRLFFYSPDLMSRLASGKAAHRHPVLHIGRPYGTLKSF